jgi:23S rRNA (guanosine2251-2'-O)-methyltransferase
MVAEFSYLERSALVGDGPCRLVLLDRITDPANLGSILRSADGFGWTGVLLPTRRSVGVTPAVRKVAAGAAERIPVARVGSTAETVSWLKDRDVWVVGLHPEADESYEGLSFSERLCLVVGAEGRGLSRLVRERSDALVRIPMEGSLASINAGVAAAIVMATEASRRRLTSG